MSEPYEKLETKRVVEHEDGSFSLKIWEQWWTYDGSNPDMVRRLRMIAKDLENE